MSRLRSNGASHGSFAGANETSLATETGRNIGSSSWRRRAEKGSTPLSTLAPSSTSTTPAKSNPGFIFVQPQWISEFYRSKTKSCVRRCPPGMLIKDFFSRERIGVFERKQQKRRKTALLMKRPDNFHPWFLSQVRNTANETWSVPLSYTLLWGCCKFQPQ